MTDQIAGYLQNAAVYAPVWGFFFIFVFMAVESSFIPFPSEVVMIPAGFLAMRGEMTTGIWWLDCLLAVLIGTAGCLAGAYVNYFLAEKLGRTLLYRYGKYFFLKPDTLERSEEIFREYGEITTFVCRLIPGIRQIISIPAGLSRMKHSSFILFTCLGAGIWNIILTLNGVYLGHLSKDLSYVELVHKGKQMISEHYIWIFLFLAVVVAGYLLVHKKVMKKKEDK
jgi:membrane protein DedA with SNARE-associated domain